VVAAAVQEDVDVLGISILSGAHLTLFPKILALLKARGGGDIVVFGGGIIPDEDAAQLKEAGVQAVFTPGTATGDVIQWVRSHVPPRRR